MEDEPEMKNALVDAAWLDAHRNDPKVRLIEIAGTGQEQMQAYKAGHVPGATCWQWKDLLWDTHIRDFPAPEELARRLGAAGIDNDSTVVFYGEGVQFGFYAWWVLTYCGHERVAVLDGGRANWVAQGLPLTTETPPAPQPANYRPAQRNESMRIGREAVRDALGKPDGLILDGRSPEEYRGERVNSPQFQDFGALRYGRIPGAQHLYFEDLFDANKRLKSPEALKALVYARHDTAGKNIITYCRMSHRATVLYFVLSRMLGCPSVRVYDGSWTEWGNLVGFPVER